MRTSVRHFVLGVLIAMAGIAVTGCNRSTTVRAAFTVEGMHCESCSSAITDALQKVEGVEDASADHENGSAEASFRSPGVSPEQLKTEIEDLGYTVTAVTTTPVES